MGTTLGEQLLLLSLDGDSGTEKERAKVAFAVSAASLVELALAGRIDVADDKATVLDSTPLGVPALDDGSVEAGVRQRLDAVVLQGVSPDPRTASLVALLHGAKLHRLAFPDADKRRVAANMAAIAHGQWSAEAVRRVVKAAEDALAAIVAVTVMTTVIGN